MGQPVEDLELFHGNLIDLVHDVDARDVLAVSFDDVDELFRSSILTENDVSAGDTILFADGMDNLVGELGEWNCSCDGDASPGLPGEADLWRLLVQTDTEALQLV